MNSIDDLEGKIIGGCRIERKIGQGGMGAVFKAQHLALSIPVALKLLLPSAIVNPGAVERFLQEARAAAKLRHPAIIGVMDVGVDHGYNYLIMEYCDGMNLNTLIDERKNGISIPEAVKIAEQILDAIDYAHKSRIVHRDIKPENILIFQSGQAKLVDLGLAKDLNNEVLLTQTSVTLGSPHYIAPEQAENPRNIDGRADLYSIGCTLFHMITGKPPFSGSSPIEVILNHIQSPIPDILKLRPTLKTSLASVIYRLMEKDPDKRFQCAADARIALLDAYRNQSPVAPVKAPVKGKKSVPIAFTKKRDLLLSSVVVILLIAIAGIIVQQIVSKKEDNRVNNSIHNNTPYNNSEKVSPVLNAVNNGDYASLSDLLNKGVSPNSDNGAETSPLHIAVFRQANGALTMLLDKGANPSYKDKYGDTPLHYALRAGSIEMTKALLSRGSNPNVTDRNGQTPLQIAKDLGRQDIVQLLKQYGAN